MQDLNQVYISIQIPNNMSEFNIIHTKVAFSEKIWNSNQRHSKQWQKPFLTRRSNIKEGNEGFNTQVLFGFDKGANQSKLLINRTLRELSHILPVQILG